MAAEPPTYFNSMRPPGGAEPHHPRKGWLLGCWKARRICARVEPWAHSRQLLEHTRRATQAAEPPPQSRAPLWLCRAPW